MANQIKLSTTGTISSITINDLFASKFVHPIIDMILCDITNPAAYPYSNDDIKNSIDIQTAVTNGYIVLRDENNNIISDVTERNFNIWSPDVDSTSSLKITKADGTTEILTVDSINSIIKTNSIGNLDGVVVFNLQDRQFFDSVNKQSLSTQDRTLNNTSGIPIIQWGSGLNVFDDSGNTLFLIYPEHPVSKISINRENPVNCLEVGMESDNDTNYISAMSSSDKTRGFSIDDTNGYKWANYVFKEEDGDTQYFASGNSQRDILVMQSDGRIGINIPTIINNLEIVRIVQTSSNTYATVTTELTHNLTNLSIVKIINATNSKFNGTFSVGNVVGLTFRINGVSVGAITEEPTNAQVIQETNIPIDFTIMPQFLDAIYSFNKSLDVGVGTGFIDLTANMRTSFGTADVILPIATGSYLYVGQKYTWKSTSFNITTATVGSTAITVEYSSGTNSWTALTTSSTSGNGLVDGTSRLTKDGNISWNLSTFKYLWTSREIIIETTPRSTEELYWIRISLTGTITVAPTAQSISNNGGNRVGVYAQSGDINPFFKLDSLGRVGFLPPELESQYSLGSLTGLTTSKFEVIAEDGARSDFIYYLANSTSASHPAIVLAKSAGTIASKTPITNGSDIGAVYGFGYDGTTFRESCKILFEADAGHGAGVVSGKMSLWTTIGTSANERMTIKSSGNIGIGITSPTATLHLKAGTATANTSPLKLTTGVALTNPENGSLEYHTSHLYFTIGTTRYQLDQPTILGTVTSGVWNGTTIAIANGGTNSTTTLNNGRVMISAGDSIVENSALTSSALVLGGISLSSLSLGTANQIVGMNNAGTGNEYKTLSVGTNGTDFNIVLNSANSIVLNLPDASTSNRGVVTTGIQSFRGQKTFTNSVIFNQNIVNNGIITVSITASQNNYNPVGLSTCNVIRISSSASYNITGLTAQESGRTIMIINIGTQAITLVTESASSTESNRFASPSNQLGAKENAILWYDITSARWRVIANSVRQS